MNQEKELIIRAPGRICLLGEHQDYFGLPVISAAINRYIEIKIKSRSDDSYRIYCPDTDAFYEFSRQDLPLKYQTERDYVRGMVNVAHRYKLLPRHGFEAVISGNIPLRGGLSGSSAFCVALGAGLLTLNQGTLPEPAKLAQFGFLGEVVEFGEYGGMMDHLSSAYGGALHIDFTTEKPIPTPLNLPTNGFLIADSQEPKDSAIAGLAKIKEGVYRALDKMRSVIPSAQLHSLTVADISRLEPNQDQKLLLGTLKTRDITVQGLTLLNNHNLDPTILGELINQQHVVLRDELQISTAKIERIRNLVSAHGALGSKIIGSGSGGCVLIYAPGFESEVKQAIRQADGQPMDITISPGVFQVA